MVDHLVQMVDHLDRLDQMVDRLVQTVGRVCRRTDVRMGRRGVHTARARRHGRRPDGRKFPGRPSGPDGRPSGPDGRPRVSRATGPSRARASEPRSGLGRIWGGSGEDLGRLWGGSGEALGRLWEASGRGWRERRSGRDGPVAPRHAAWARRVVKPILRVHELWFRDATARVSRGDGAVEDASTTRAPRQARRESSSRTRRDLHAKTSWSTSSEPFTPRRLRTTRTRAERVDPLTTPLGPAGRVPGHAGRVSRELGPTAGWSSLRFTRGGRGDVRGLAVVPSGRSPSTTDTG
jgi:hypothetical protein